MHRNSVTRRDAILLALSGLVWPAMTVPVGTARAQDQAQSANDTTAAGFSAAYVIALARAGAAKPFKAPVPSTLGELASLPLAQVEAIRYRASEMIWADDKLPFVIEPLHRSQRMPGEVELYMVADAGPTPIQYESAKFDFGKLKSPPPAQKLGFAGVRIHVRDRDGTLRPVAILQNGAVLAAIARNQEWGAISRPLTVRTGDQRTEEAIQLRAIWIEKPDPAASSLEMYALVDTPSLTGAFHFSLRANDATLIDTECTIITRRKVDHFGLTPIQATHLAGPLGSRDRDDIRRAVYEVGGAQMLTGAGEWIWRPVVNRERLQTSAFVDLDPQGFGLLQRKRSFSDFLDDEHAWQRRPSVWVQPIGKWGKGEVTLMEIPAAAVTNKNIACYWRPKSGLAAGSENHFAYRQVWSQNSPDRPDNAIVTVTRTGRMPGSSSNLKRRFIVQFSGGQLADQARAETIVPHLWTSSGTIVSLRTYRTAKNGTMRIVFDFDPGSQPLVELRLVLQHSTTPASETWLYRWTP